MSLIPIVRVNELEDGEEQSRGDDGALLEGNEELFPGYEYQYEPSRLEVCRLRSIRDLVSAVPATTSS